MRIYECLQGGQSAIYCQADAWQFPSILGVNLPDRSREDGGGIVLMIDTGYRSSTLR